MVSIRARARFKLRAGEGSENATHDRAHHFWIGDRDPGKNYTTWPHPQRSYRHRSAGHGGRMGRRINWACAGLVLVWPSCGIFHGFGGGDPGSPHLRLGGGSFFARSHYFQPGSAVVCLLVWLGERARFRCGESSRHLIGTLYKESSTGGRNEELPLRSPDPGSQRTTDHCSSTTELSSHVWAERMLSAFRHEEARTESRFSLRKEVIQPQVLLQLPCYDFTPIMGHTRSRYRRFDCSR